MDEVPNLDAMPHDELLTFWSTYRRGRNARGIFKERTLGIYGAASNLAAYAMNKACAIDLRLKGLIDEALRYEALCDRIYKGLPEWARW